MTDRSDPGANEWLALATLTTVWVGTSAGAALSADVDPFTQLALVIIGAAVAMGGRGLHRTRWLMVLALVSLSAGSAADRRWVPVEPDTFAGQVSLITDPRGEWPVVWAEAELDDGRRVEVRATGQLASELGTASAGARLGVEASLAPIDDSGHHRARHLVGRATIRSITSSAGPAGWRGPVEAVRRVVVGGAPLRDEATTALYLGLVIGDDRAQDAVQRSRFRAAGMTHLLAVSGQNVAFVLAAASPLIRRLGRRWRFGAVALILVVFAVITRLEPSVLRATWTAAVATWALLSGRSSTGITTVAAAVSILLLVDPALRLSLGFRLSVAATLGILVLGPLVVSRLRGPIWLRSALAVTISAQLGVLPLLDRTFGPVPLASLPANLLAGPAAGAVMTWGMTVGPLLGLVRPPTAVRRVIEQPVWAALGWLDGVAAFAADLPLPTVGVGSVLLGLVAWLAVALAIGRPESRRLAAIALVLVASATVVSRPTDDLPWVELAPGAEIVRLDRPGGDALVVLVVDRPRSDVVVDQLVLARLRTVDVVIALHGGRSTRDVVADVDALVAIGAVLAPMQHRIPGAVRLDRPVLLGDGDTALLVEPAPDDRLTARFTGRTAHLDTTGWGISPRE